MVLMGLIMSWSWMGMKRVMCGRHDNGFYSLCRSFVFILLGQFVIMFCVLIAVLVTLAYSSLVG